jgi:hypothetical protein
MNKNRLSTRNKRLRKRMYYGLIAACLLIILVFLVSLQLIEIKALSGDELKTLRFFNAKIASCEFQSPPQSPFSNKSHPVPKTTSSSAGRPQQIKEHDPNWLHYNSYLYMLMLESSCLSEVLDTRFLGKWNLWISITGLFALSCLIRLILRSWLSALSIVCISIATIYFRGEIGLISPFHSTQSLVVLTLLLLLLYQISGSIFIQLSYHFSLTALLLFDASFISWLVLLPLAILISRSRDKLAQESIASHSVLANTEKSENFSIFNVLKKIERRIQAYPIFFKTSRHLHQRLNLKKHNKFIVLSITLQLIVIVYLRYFANPTTSIFTQQDKSTLSLDLIFKFIEDWSGSLMVSTTASSFVAWIFVFCLHLFFLIVRSPNNGRLEFFVKMLLLGFWLHFASWLLLDFYNFQTPHFSRSSYRQTTALFTPLILIAVAAYVYNIIEGKFFPRFQKAREIEFV